MYVHEKTWHFDVEIRISQKMVCLAHENRRNEGYAHFEARLTLIIGRTGREGQLDA